VVLAYELSFILHEREKKGVTPKEPSRLVPKQRVCKVIEE
jgi:hypothetical protein